MTANTALETRSDNAQGNISRALRATPASGSFGGALFAFPMLVATNAQAIVLNTINDVWIREWQPTAIFESDLASVCNSHNTSDVGKSRYGVVEFHVSRLSGIF